MKKIRFNINMSNIINLDYECHYNLYGSDYITFEIKYHLKEVSEEFLCNNKIKFRLRSKEDEVIFTLDCRTFSIQENDALYEWANNNIRGYYRDNLEPQLKNCLIETVSNYVKSLSLETQCREIHFIYALAKTNQHFSALKSPFYDFEYSFIVLMSSLGLKIVDSKEDNLLILHNHLIFSNFSKGLGNKLEIGYNIFMKFEKVENERKYYKNDLPSEPYTVKYINLLIIRKSIRLSSLVQKHTILYQSNNIALVPDGNVTPDNYIIQCIVIDNDSNILFKFNYTPFLES